MIHCALEAAGVEFIDENGGGPGVRLQKRQWKKGEAAAPVQLPDVGAVRHRHWHRASALDGSKSATSCDA